MPQKLRMVEDIAGGPIALTAEAALTWTDEITAAEGGEKKLKRFTMLAYTGGPMQVEQFFRPVVVDLAGVRKTGSQLPILRMHDPDRIVGHGEVEITPQKITAAGVISGAGQDAEEVQNSALNGFPWQASIGASVDEAEFIPEGESATVNGRTVKGPVIIARKSTLKEISFVPRGADARTSARVAASAAGETIMDFTKWVQAMGFEPDTLTDTQRTNLQAKFDAEQKGGGRPGVEAKGTDGASLVGDPVKQYRDLVAAESERVGRIRKLCADAGHPTMKVEANGAAADVDIEATAIREGWTVDKTELHVMRAERPKAPAVHVGGVPDLTAKVAEAALLLAAGVPEEKVGKWYPEQAMNVATSGPMQGFTLQSLMASVIRAAGRSYSGGFKTSGFIEAALRADQQIRAAAGGFSTVSLSNTLENVAGKTMIAAYEAKEVTWPMFAAQRNHSDFKAHSRVRLDAAGSFRKIGPDGELKHVGLTDAKYTNQVETYGAIIALTRQMMINDDLDSFLQIPRFLGDLGAGRLEEEVYVVLLSNPGSFFHANNANLLTGAGSALAIAGLTSAEAAFLNQVGPNGRPILTSPSVLLVPTTLKVTGDNIYTEVTLAGGTAADVNRNPHAGKYRPVTSPYLNNTAIRDEDGNAITGQSATAWYLFANPTVRPAISVAFLNGQNRPKVESAETDFSTLGMQWRGYFDFGVGMEDPKGAVKNAGA